MKKGLLALVLVLSLGLFAACGLFEEEEPEPDIDPTEIQFYNSEGWDEVYATAQDADGEELLGEFPGEEATLLEDVDVEDADEDFYAIDVPVEDLFDNPVTISFNDGDEEESEPVTVNHPDHYFVTYDGEGPYGSRADAAFAMREVEETTVYFYNAYGWENLGAYAWNDAGDQYFGDWPGSSDAVQEDDREDWYYVEVPEEVDEVEIGFIINGEDEEGEDVQTEDILINDSELVYTHPDIPDESYAYRSDETAEHVFDVMDETTTVNFYNYAVEGTDFEGWDEVYVDAVDHEGEVLVEDEEVEEHFGNWHPAYIPFVFNDEEENDEENDEEENNDAYFEVTFHDGNGEEAETQTITEETDNYVIYNELFASREDAELTAAGVTVVYFYDAAGWDNVYVEITDDEALDEETTIDPYDDAGEFDWSQNEWYEIIVPTVLEEDESFDITVDDGNDNSVDATIDDEEYIYLTEIDLYNDMVEATALAEKEVNDVYETIYFYNVHEWDELGGYLWDPAELLGGWPGGEAEHDEGNWYYIDVPGLDLEAQGTDFIFNGIDSEIEDEDEQEVQTDDVEIPDSDHVYIAIDNVAYTSKEDAEEATEDYLAETQVHFYNSEGWDAVHATVDDGEEVHEIEGVVNEDAPFEDWYLISVPWALEENESFDITFHDGDDAESDPYTVAYEETDLYMSLVDRFPTLEQATIWTDYDEDLFTVYFYNSDDWDAVQVWSWMHFGDEEVWTDPFDGYPEADLEWPGPEIDEAEEDGWYYVELPVDPDSEQVPFVDFINAEDDEVGTGEVELIDSDHAYVTVDGEIFESMDDAENHIAD